MMEVMGPRSYLRPGSSEALLNGHIESMYRGLVILTFGGGTNEIQRDLIGMFGLGLPRAPRF
jgi:alkylation response protein AidB-like acyl-CoA dehydrogenase